MKKTRLPNLISILILTVITSLMWISFSIYRAVTTQVPPNVPKAVSEPLTPTLDTETITKIESRIFLDSSQIPQNVITQTGNVTTPAVETPLPTPIASPEATPEATLAPSPSPTP